jgi:crossover junction endodeoxyribonuclease RusA
MGVTMIELERGRDACLITGSDPGHLLILPYPPSVNDYYIRRRGRVTLTDEARVYKDRAGVMNSDPRRTPIEGPVRCRIWVWMPDHRVRDLDNLLKALLDAGTHCRIWADDHQVESLTIVRAGVCRGGRVVMLAEGGGGSKS